MRYIPVVVAALLWGCANGYGETVRHPFPADISYANCIRPSLPVSQLHADVRAYYDYWKAKYLKRHPHGGYYVHTEREFEGVHAIGNSEGQGYGMIVAVLMAGHDPDARKIFDGFLALYDKSPSAINGELMAWLITSNEKPGHDNAALDGDMDVAYALLLAADQWRDSGGEHYRTRADRLIRRGIEHAGFHVESNRLNLGDWNKDPWLSRPSDWSPGHIRAFYGVTGNPKWKAIFVDSLQGMRTLQENFSKGTGLLPDFVVGQRLRPASPGTVEGDRDGRYSYNACRIPWRLATDFAHHGTKGSAALVRPMVKFAEAVTQGDPKALVAEYELDGAPVVKYRSNTTLAPMLAGCITNAEHQAFLDKGWPVMMARKRNYYGDSLTLLCSLLIAGDWWAPEVRGKIPPKKR